MIGTFAFVLVFTMFKELYEDLSRHRQDRELNNKLSLVFEPSGQFKEKRWSEI
jgi:hypothetical protein